MALLAVRASSTGDVERYRTQGADSDELDVPADLDHLTKDLMAKDQAGRRSGSAADHVLVRTADVRRHNLDDDAVLADPADVRWMHAGPVAEFQLWVVDVLHLDMTR